MPWGIDRVFGDSDENRTTAWEQSSRGVGVRVAVVDSGIGNQADPPTHPLPFHEDLEIGGGVHFVDSRPEDEWHDVVGNGHGTLVAGIISAIDNDIGVVGVAPNIGLYARTPVRRNGPDRTLPYPESRRIMWRTTKWELRLRVP